MVILARGTPKRDGREPQRITQLSQRNASRSSHPHEVQFQTQQACAAQSLDEDRAQKHPLTVWLKLTAANVVRSPPLPAQCSNRRQKAHKATAAHASTQGPNDPGMTTAATPASVLVRSCSNSWLLRHDNAHKCIGRIILQAPCKRCACAGMQLHSAIARAMGSGLSYTSRIRCGLLFEMLSDLQEGLQEFQERARSSPARREGEWGKWTQSRAF